MPFCAIITCDASTDGPRDMTKDLYFHRFPANPEVMEKWVEMTGRENWTPEESSVICSKHFRDNDYTIKRSGNRYLKSTAVPCEFVVYKPFILDEMPDKSEPPSFPLMMEENATELEITYPIPDEGFATYIDCNENILNWDPFKPKIDLDPPSPDSVDYGTTPAYYGSSVTNIRPTVYYPSSTSCSTPQNPTPLPQSSDVAPIPASVQTDQMALQEIRAVIAKYKTYSLKDVTKACIDELQEAKDIKVRLLSGDMNDVDKAEAIIKLQKIHFRKFTAKYKRLRKITKNIIRILKKIDQGNLTANEN